MDRSELKNRTIVAMIVKASEKFLTLGMQFIISIIIARTLDPSNYGIIAIVNVFFVIFYDLIEGGLGVGLVHKKEVSSIDISTVFYSSVILGIVLAIITFLIAPYIASFYDIEQLTEILRVYSVAIIIASITSVQNAQTGRELQYQSQLVSSIISNAISGIVGIWMAKHNYQVWALIWQQILQKSIYAISMAIINKFHYKFVISLNSLKSIVSFSWKIVFSRIITTIFGQIRSLIIGKQYSEELLGYYNKGDQTPSTIQTAVDYSIQTVIFSAYSKVSDDQEKLKNMLRRTIKINSYILFPTMLGLCAVAKPAIKLILTEKWLPCVDFFRIACVAKCVESLNGISVQTINSIGRSDISLRIDIQNKIFTAITIAYCIFVENIYFLAFSAIITALYDFILYSIAKRQYINYKLSEQLLDLLPNVILTIIMLCFVYLAGQIKLNYIIVLFIQVLVGITSYVLLSLVTKNENMLYLLKIILKKTDRNI